MTAEDDALSRAMRINLLFDFYGTLLTDKQRLILAFYYHDDFSLGEIASELGISRQAVHDNMKRAEQALEGYESKLLLLGRHEALLELTRQLERSVEHMEMLEGDKSSLKAAIGRLRAIENMTKEGGAGLWQHSKG